MINIVNEAINRKLASMSFTNIITGKVESLEPLQIRVNSKIVIGQSFIEPMSLGLNDYSPNSALPLVVGETIQMVRYNNGQRFYVLGKAVNGSAVDYTQLNNLPRLNTSNTKSQECCTEDICNTINLHKISKSGSYNDLLNRPIIDYKVQKKLYDFNGHGINVMNGRVTSINFDKTPNEYGTKRFDILTNQVTDLEDDPGDGFVETYFWDNEGKWDSQLYIPNQLGDGKLSMAWRTKSNNDDWSKWYHIIDSNGGAITDGHLYLRGINDSSYTGNKTKIIFTDANKTIHGAISASANGIYFMADTSDTVKSMGYDRTNNAFRPTSGNTTAVLGTSSYPWKHLHSKGGTLQGHLYLNGVKTSTIESTSMLVFGDSTTKYAAIRANTSGAIVLSNSMTSNDIAVAFEPADKMLAPVNDASMSLGNSARKWKDVYAKNFIGQASQLRGCYALDDTTGYSSTPWHKIASITISSAYQDRYIVFLVTYGWNNGKVGILKARIRAGSTKVMEAYSLQWIFKSDDIPLSEFNIVYTNVANTSTTAEIWWKCPQQYMGVQFTVLDAGDRQQRGNYWTLYNSNSGVASKTEGTGSKDSELDAVIVSIANNARVINTNPTSLTDYYPTFITGAGDSVALRANNGCVYQTQEGTTSANGRGLLSLGNSKATGTAGNKFGCLRLYSKLSGYINLQYADETGNNTIFLPNYNGNAVVSTSATNYEKLSDGTLICYGSIQCPIIAAASDKQATATLPVAFANTNYRVSLTRTTHVSFYASIEEVISSKATNKFTVNFYNTEAAGSGNTTPSAINYDYIAIGRWK